MYSNFIGRGHKGSSTVAIQEEGVVMRSEGAGRVSKPICEDEIASMCPRITKLLLILLLVCLSHCSIIQARVDQVNGWPCPNITGFNTPEQTCQRHNVRID